MDDIRTLTDEELDQLRIDVLTERERRSKLERIPDEVNQLARQYVEGGGDVQDVVKAVTEKPEPAPDEHEPME